MPARPNLRPPPAKAPAKQSDPGNSLALLESGQWSAFLARYEGQFGAVVPDHIKVESFVALAAAYVRRDPKLQEAAVANPGSLILALRECAALGHLPMRGTFSLVPFKDNKPDRPPWSIVGIEEYQGLIQRMYRAGGVTSVHAEVVRERDRCRFQAARMALPDHEYDEFADPEERGPLKAVYAWARMITGGTSAVAWLPRGQVAKHRAMSRSGDAFWGPPWPAEGKWTEDMWKKTALHKLEAMVPTSSAYRMEVARSEAAAAGAGFAGIPDRSPRQAVYDMVEDAEVIDEPAPAARGRRPGPTGDGPARGDQPADPDPQGPAERAESEPWPEVPPIPNGDKS